MIAHIIDRTLLILSFTGFRTDINYNFCFLLHIKLQETHANDFQNRAFNVHNLFCIKKNGCCKCESPAVLLEATPAGDSHMPTVSLNPFIPQTVMHWLTFSAIWAKVARLLDWTTRASLHSSPASVRVGHPWYHCWFTIISSMDHFC